MDATPWTQGFQDIKLAKTMEEQGNNNNNNNTCSTMTTLERKARPQEQLNCPRCNSTNTKFCYYNNYSLTQPRYFCKTCRRYWTAGGSLRNVPVGGGSRKNKRSSSSNSTSSSTSFMSSSSSASSSKLLVPDLNPPNLSQFSSHHQNPSKAQHGQDLNLDFPLSIQESSTQGTSISYNCYNYIDQVSAAEQEQQNLNNQAHNPSSCASASSALELLRSGIASRGLNSYIPTLMPDSHTLYPSGFPLQDLKPALTFSVDGLGNRYGVQDNGGRMFFPFGEVKQLPSSSEVDQSKSQGNPTPQGGYWNGMLGGGSW